MSRSVTYKIDRDKFEAVINYIMLTQHFGSWSDVCADMAVNHDLLRSVCRTETITARTAKLLDRLYGVKLGQYVAADEGTEQGEAEDELISVLKDVAFSLDKINETLGWLGQMVGKA